MASIRHEIVVFASQQHVWSILSDIGAVHERLLPGRVVSTKLEGAERILTFCDGHAVRELIVTVDDEAYRLAYSVIDGARPSLEYHHASFDVRDEGENSRLIWTTDILPDSAAPGVRIRTELGITEMKQTIEAAAPRRQR